MNVKNGKLICLKFQLTIIQKNLYKNKNNFVQIKN